MHNTLLCNRNALDRTTGEWAYAYVWLQQA